MKTYVLRAPHTDRFGLEVPCSPADLKCAASVIARRSSQIFENTGTLVSGVTVDEDTKSLVTAVTPLTVTIKEAGLYLVSWASAWEVAAFGDVSASFQVLKNGASVWTSPFASRIGPLHTYYVTVPLRFAVGDAVTFRIVPAVTTTITQYITVTSLGP